ncbi:MAG: hypothetical protein ACLQJR_30090 [Stellaceae bacterium]
MLGLEDIAHRMWVNLIVRPSGPFGFRFLMQPAMATIFAIRDGLKDARAGRSPYFWTIMTKPAKRGGRLREGFVATWKIIVLALVLDAVYQFIELETFYLGEATVVAILLAIIPYLLIRGPAARIARRWRSHAGRPDGV